MSEDKKPSEGEANQSGEGPKVDVTEVQKRLAELEASNKRLLDESKNWKSKTTEYKSKLDKIEEENLKASGDLAKQLEHERKKAEESAKEAKKLRNATIDAKIRSTVSKYAGDVHDLDDLLNQSQFLPILKEGINPEDLSIDENAAKNFVNKVFEAKPWLKKNSSQPTVDTTRANASHPSKEKSFKKGEEKSVLADALKDWA